VHNRSFIGHSTTCAYYGGSWDKFIILLYRSTWCRPAKLSLLSQIWTQNKPSRVRIKRWMITNCFLILFSFPKFKKEAIYNKQEWTFPQWYNNMVLYSSTHNHCKPGRAKTFFLPKSRKTYIYHSNSKNTYIYHIILSIIVLFVFVLLIFIYRCIRLWYYCNPNLPYMYMYISFSLIFERINGRKKK